MNKYAIFGLLVLSLVVLGIGAAISQNNSGPAVPTDLASSTTVGDSEMASSTAGIIINNLKKVEPMHNPHVTLTTNLGVIELELFSNQVPNTVENFVKLAQAGFYTGTLFHRVIPGFMIQGGDPLTKSDPTNFAIHGTGGPGYTFADEIGPDNHNNIGTIAMANAGPNTNGSQFFINVANNNFLDDKHTVFGKVVTGMDVVNKIVNVKRNANDHPLEDVQIEKVSVH